MPAADEDLGAASAASVLRIDLDAIAANYRLLRNRIGGADCAAAVKADAYGTGASKVAPVLADQGCTTFFVATVDEGIELRRTLSSVDIAIAVLNGVLAGTEDAFAEHRLVPVINDLGQVDRWRRMTERTGVPLEAVLHVDTGINRLGLTPGELDKIAEAPELLAGPTWRCVMSHLARADEPDHPMNGEQLARFNAARRRLPRMPASLANSGAVFLGPDYHFDLARPGIALYGGNPHIGTTNPMRQVVRLMGRILQVRDVEPGMTVGYAGAHAVKEKGRVATVAAGYADGYVRSAGARAHVYLGQTRLPVIGRISMDLITVDVTAAPVNEARPGAFVELLGDRFTPDDAARAARTIPHEFLTGLGRRYHRRYARGATDG